MVTLAECLMTAILIVVPPPAHSSYDAPTMGGGCMGSKGSRASIYVDDEHRLIIEHAYTRYEIPLPVKVGTFNIRYILGSQKARVQRTSHDPDTSRLGQELVDGQWFTVMVRFGPKEIY